MYPSRSACAANEGKVFEVGPGKEYTSLKAVPWLTLIPCDQVNIHYSSTPYKDIIVLTSRGRANKWITIKGIPGPNGELPILDGAGAVMPKNTGANSWIDSVGMIIISKPDATQVSRSGSYKPGYLHISGLKIRNARPPSTVTKLSGSTAAWDAFSSGIYISGGEQVAITDCELTGNGLGIFANSGGGEYTQTRNLLIRHNYIYGNSNVSSFREHNAYTEGIGTVYEYNYFGAPIAGTYGDNIKERSAGVIFRYNYVEGGSNLLALRDPDSNVDYERIQVDAWGEKLVTAAFVYSNILVTRNYVEGIIGHGDGPAGVNQVREGALHFYNNRVISTVDNQAYWAAGQYYTTQPVPLFTLINAKPTTVYARNNELYATSRTAGATPAPIGIFFWQGAADFQSNWANRFANSKDGATGYNNLYVGTKFNGTGLGGLTASSADPGFVDFAGSNFLTTSTAPYASLAAPYHAAVTLRKLTPTAEPVIKPFQAIQ